VSVTGVVPKFPLEGREVFVVVDVVDVVPKLNPLLVVRGVVDVGVDVGVVDVVVTVVPKLNPLLVVGGVDVVGVVVVEAVKVKPLVLVPNLKGVVVVLIVVVVVVSVVVEAVGISSREFLIAISNSIVESAVAIEVVT
jgi:hypothetical protein